MSSKKRKTTRQLSLQDEITEFLLYTAPGGGVKVEVILNNETLWLPQQRMADLFNVGVPAISKHLKNIFETGELEEESVISILETTAADGKKYRVKYYSLDAIICVGYRVNSRQATRFRIWATQLIKEYITKGFALDDERLKNGRYFGKDYFRELLERTVSGFFYYIEGIIERRHTFTMESFADSVNKFLAFNEYQVLEDYGKISRQQAKARAFAEYEKFNETQRFESDFDRIIKEIEQKKSEDEE